MREIEIKARVSDEKALRKKLTQMGIRLSDPIKQCDKVFGVPGAIAGAKSNWLRIRTQNDKTYIFNLKRSISGQLDSIEHETEITNAIEMENIIFELGFEPYSDITKTRQTAKLGEVEICLDIVEGLGVFVELEKLCEHNEDPEKIKAELWKIFESFGINRSDEVTEGYDVMLKNL